MEAQLPDSPWGEKGLDYTSNTPTSIAQPKELTPHHHPLISPLPSPSPALKTKETYIHTSHRPIANNHSLQLSPQGSAQRKQAKIHISQFLPGRLHTL